MSNTDAAILKLAQLIDALENIPREVQQHKEFRSRYQLIKDILDGKEE